LRTGARFVSASRHTCHFQQLMAIWPRHTLRFAAVLVLNEPPAASPYPFG